MCRSWWRARKIEALEAMSDLDVVRQRRTDRERGDEGYLRVRSKREPRQSNWPQSWDTAVISV